MMMMIAFITLRNSLLPLIEGSGANKRTLGRPKVN